MRIFTFTVIACILLYKSQGGSAGVIGDTLGQITKASFGVLKSIPHAIPTPNEFFELGKNAILGFPSTVVFDMINNFCKYFIRCDISDFEQTLLIFRFDCSEYEHTFGESDVYTTSRKHFIHFENKIGKYDNSDYKPRRIMESQRIQSKFTAGDFRNGLENEFVRRSIQSTRYGGSGLFVSWKC